MSHLAARSSPRPAIAFHRAVALSLAALAAATASPAFAAKIYRCGNVFQDQPCPEVKIAAAAVPADRGIVMIRDTSCATPSRDNPGRGECGKAPPPRDVAAEGRR